MKTTYSDETIDYSGKELRSHWLMEKFGMVGDAAASFVGACHVAGEDLVDREDFTQGNIVAGESMLHFIVEIFGIGLPGIVFAQRLLCTIVHEAIDSACAKVAITRKGDDLYVGEGKLSVSVATVSPVSGLIHLGLNMTTAGVPVTAAGLAELGVDHERLALEVLGRFGEEVDSCLDAAKKVKPVI